MLDNFKLDKYSSSPQKNLYLTLFLLISLIVTTQLVDNPLNLFSRAQEVAIPAHLSPLEYVDQLKRTDVDDDGVVNLFDYASVIDPEVYGKTTIYDPQDIDKNGKIDALDLSVVISEIYVDVADKIDVIEKDDRLAAAIADEIVKKNEQSFPTSLKIETVEGSTAVLAEESKSEKSFGRETIPSVLGTVSPFTGASSFEFPFSVPSGPSGFAPTLGIAYSSQSVDDARACCGEEFKDGLFYSPSIAGHGFSLSGVGSITRDTKGEKDVYVLNGEVYHRFILTLPSGISAELKYNMATKRWASIPQGFINIEHNPPEKQDPQGFDFTFLDAGEWVITSKDGTKYFLGEENLAEKINNDGRIIGSKDIKGDHNDLKGTWDGNLYVDFDKSDLCTGQSEFDPCKERENAKHPVLMVNKWLLRKIETNDGKTINYNYETQQSYLPFFGKKTWENSIDFVTSSSYLRYVTWNDGKHRVVFEYESRPDRGFNEYMNGRLKNVKVETKLENDNKYHLVRRYGLAYHDRLENSEEKLGAGVKNGFKASFLTSIQEFGSDNSSSLPATTFRYKQYSFSPYSPTGEAIYVGSINNGLGGITHFAYQPYEFFAITPFGNGSGRQRRVRVIQHTVEDKVEGKSFRTDYDYHNSQQAYAERLRDSANASPPSGMQFLGHGVVESRTYDFDGRTLLSHGKTEFYQANSTDKCFIPHPAKGQPKRSITYNGDLEASTSVTTYKYRLDGEDNKDPDVCDPKLANQPYFVYATRTDNTIRESEIPNILPQQAQALVSVTPKSVIRTMTDNLSYDAYGNVTKAVSYGEVNPETGQDVNPSDNRLTFVQYVSNPQKWILGVPYISFSSPDPDCDKKSGTAYNDCQYSRSEVLYDNKALGEAPDKGYVTESRSYIDGNTIAVSKQEYDEYGNMTKSWGAKPGEKTTTSMVLNLEHTYDPYYHSLVQETKNALGHKIRYENYDYLLQAPTILKAQTNVSPERFSASKMDYDSLGRLVRTYMPDPEHPGFVLGNPSLIKHYFELGDKGMVKREMALASLVDSKFTYTTADTFYDGIGRARQTQVLSTGVDGQRQRVVASTVSDASGNTHEKYDTQTAPAVSIPDYNPGSPDSIKSVQPEYVIPAKVVLERNTFDGLGRPVEHSVVNAGGAPITTRSQYFVNGQKTIAAKGNESVSLSDSLGRAVATTSFSPGENKLLVTRNEYGMAMVDKPTKTEILSPNSADVAVITNQYDRAGRVVSLSDPSLGTYSFEYDIAGNKILEKSQPGQDITYEYDILGRLVKQKYPGKLYKTTLRDEVEYAYDSGDNALGKLVRVKHPVGEVTYHYDNGQRVVKTERKVFDNQKEFTATFNKLSQQMESTFPNNDKIEYAYDLDGKVAKTRLNGQDLLTGSKIDKNGKVTSAEATVGGKHYRDNSTYDAFGRLKSLSVIQDSQTLLNQQLTFNNFSEISQINENVLGASASNAYQYDAFSQLVGARTGALNSDYSYDIFGRLQNKKEATEIGYTNNAVFPFFAPKSITLAGQTPPPAEGPTPSATPTGPINTPLPIATQVPTRAPTSIPANTTMPTIRPTSVPPTNPQQCVYYAKTYVRKCENANCTQWSAMRELDDNVLYGVSNRQQIETLPPASQPVSKFNDDDIEGVGEQIYQNNNFTPPPGNFRKQYTQLYYDANNWEIVKREATGVGAPSQSEIDRNTNMRQIGEFNVDCGTNVSYGWYLRRKSGAQSFNLESLSSQFNLNYTPEGALMGDTEACYFYNQEGQLNHLKKKKNAADVCSESTPADKELFFYYDYEGTLVLQEEYKPGELSNPINKLFLFGLYEERSAQNQPISRLNIPITSHVSAVKEGASISVVTRDYLGSTRAVIDGSNSEDISYYPNGSETTAKDIQKTDHLFTGHRKLDDMSVYHAGARFYSPQTGLFIQPDSVAGPHRYSYVDNNPITFADPGGKYKLDLTDISNGQFPLQPIVATGVYDPDRVDKDIPENLAYAAKVFSVGMIAGMVAPGVSLAAVRGCMGNPVGCMAAAGTVGEIALGDAMPPGPSLVSVPGRGLMGRFMADELGSIAPELYQDAGNITLQGLKQAERGGVDIRMMRKSEWAGSRYSPGHGRNLTQNEVGGVAYYDRREVAINPNTQTKGATILHEVSGHMLGQQRYMSPTLYKQYPAELVDGLREIEAYYYEARNIRGGLAAFQGQMPFSYEYGYRMNLEHSISKVQQYQQRALQLIGAKGYSHDVLRRDFGAMYDYLYKIP